STGRNPILVTTSDPYDVNPGSYTLTGGSVSVTNVSVYTAGLTTLFAVDQDSTTPTLAGAVSTFTVAAAPASQIQLVLPGESAVPGNASLTRGVSGTPSTQLAGANFNVTVNLTDGYWNPVLTATSTVQIVSSDPNDTAVGPWPGYGKDPVTLSITTGTYVFPMS